MNLENRPEYEKYDEVFRAFGNLYRSPEDAREMFQRLLGEHPHSVTTRLFYAASLGHVALLTDGGELPREALEEMAVVQRVSGDSPVVAAIHLFCIAVAFAESDPTDDEIEKWKSLAQQLRRTEHLNTEFAIWNTVQAIYLEEIGETGAALNEWEQAAEHGVYVDAYVARAMRGDNRAAIREHVGKLPIFSEAYLDAGLPSRRKAFVNRFSTAEMRRLTNQELEDAILGLLFMGDLAAARSASEAFETESDAGPYLSYPNPRDYLHDEETEDQFVDRCGGTRLEKQEAHFVIAMKEFAQGNRGAAIAALGNCIAQRQINNETHQIAKTIRDRLINEQEWPNRIQPAQETTQ